MSVEDELRRLLREVVREEVRAALAEHGLVRTPADVDQDQWLTISEAAARLKVHRSTISKMIERGLLPRHSEGRLLRLRRRDVDQVLKTKPGGEVIDLDAVARRIRGRGGN